MILQAPEAHDELALIATFQWYELWFRVLVSDLAAIFADRGQTFNTIKFLRRGGELFKLFDLQLAFGEFTLVREQHVTKTLRQAQGLSISSQLMKIRDLSQELATLRGGQELDDAIEDYLLRLHSFLDRYERFAGDTLVSSEREPQTFSEWLALAQLLNLQQGVKADWTAEGEPPPRHYCPDLISADENMFIIVHQCFEIWFQVLLDHIDHAIPSITSGGISQANRIMRRTVQIMQLLVQQIQIPATMLPLDFARFRSESTERDGVVFHRGLSPASGTESYQFREIEIVSGLRDDQVFRNYLNTNDKLPIHLITPRQEERLAQTSLKDAFHQALLARHVEKIDDLFTTADAPNPNIDLLELADNLLAFDETFRSWRLGHVSMVEKMIGSKSGTGFLGPEYLMETAGYRIQEKNRVLPEKQIRPRFFEELWAVRTRLGR